MKQISNEFTHIFMFQFLFSQTNKFLIKLKIYMTYDMQYYKIAIQI